MRQEKVPEERRKYVRLKATVEIMYTVIGAPGEIKVFSKNISAGGLCIMTKEQLADATPLQLEIRIPDLQGSIRALARVIWQKRFETAGEEPQICFNTGIEFIGISDFDRFNINRYVMEHV